ncbi:MAG: hypothetical protein IT381_18585 [Deltaproteobacteria bacterium]|nr:hypothetical protein [Deltaproteobacteria bacterium]
MATSPATAPAPRLVPSFKGEILKVTILPPPTQSAPPAVDRVGAPPAITDTPAPAGLELVKPANNLAVPMTRSLPAAAAREAIADRFYEEIHQSYSLMHPSRPDYKYELTKIGKTVAANLRASTQAALDDDNGVRKLRARLIALAPPNVDAQAWFVAVDAAIAAMEKELTFVYHPAMRERMMAHDPTFWASAVAPGYGRQYYMFIDYWSSVGPNDVSLSVRDHLARAQALTASDAWTSLAISSVVMLPLSPAQLERYAARIEEISARNFIDGQYGEVDPRLEALKDLYVIAYFSPEVFDHVEKLLETTSLDRLGLWHDELRDLSWNRMLGMWTSHKPEGEKWRQDKTLTSAEVIAILDRLAAK